jgi:hypothetical protein
MQSVDGREESDDLVGQKSRWSRIGVEGDGRVDGVKESHQAGSGLL